jgi:hypothetical protein
MPLYLPRKVAAQPQGRARVDFANPLSRYVTFAWTASNGFQESVSGQVKNSATNGDLVVNGVRSSRGIVQNSSANGAVFWGLYGRFVNSINNQFTIGVAFQIRDLTNNVEMFSVTNGSSYYNIIGLASSKIRGYTTGANTTVDSNNTVSVGDWIYAVYVLQNGNFHLYVNGVKQTAVGTGTLPSSSVIYDRVEFNPSRVNLLTAFVATRPWSQAEVTSWTNNPWQIFAPSTVTVVPQSITYTYSRPASDVTTQWSTSSGTTHYTLIDETVADDGDYIVATAAGQTDEVKLASMTPPQVGTNLVINYKVTGVDGGATVTVSLRQGSGGTLIKTDTAKNANGTYALTVAPGDWAAVTDWSDLRLRFVSA